MSLLASFGIGESESDRVRTLVERTPVVAVESLSPGPAAVEGRVRKHRESVSEPLGDGECVFARYQRIRRSDGETVERSAETVPFVVEDDTGRLLVDLRGPTEDDGDPVVVSAGNTTRYFGDEDGETLVPMDGGGDETAAVAAARSELGSDPEWIHVQSVIGPGDEVYVLGDVAETPGGSPPYVVAPDAGETVVCSDLSQSSLAEQIERASGGIDRRFWAFAILGLIALLIVVVAIGVFVDSFLL